MTDQAPLITARGLVKRFGEFAAVDGIDITVPRGEAFGFLGPNGAGKTSTMRMIGCVSVWSPVLLVHAGILVALTIVGIAIAARRIEALLLK